MGLERRDWDTDRLGTGVQPLRGIVDGARLRIIRFTKGVRYPMSQVINGNKIEDRIQEKLAESVQRPSELGVAVQTLD